ncbi:TetR/AcrR family transcriptional regulator [Fodinicola feengrottensis]|uniref:TetR/AcrR family transcriptional regulator n=1 Tax=Fodinicola feengrottensis TaxID=435914 RepID=A0ABN2J571_9ACTN|nr:TetR/AcrR family transcriptional regulator [Fodinicola feengrottensis]
MSQDPTPPDAGADLVRAAIDLLAERGPQALQARRLAIAAGTSTMAVYSRFGGMPELVRAVAREGFARLCAHLKASPQTDDCVADLLKMAGAYRQNALENRHLYQVMFGLDESGAQSDTAEGRTAFGYLLRAATRCIDAGRLDQAPPLTVAAQLWSAMHGYVLLEMAGYFGTTGATDVLPSLTTNLVIGLGDLPERARASAAK